MARGSQIPLRVTRDHDLAEEWELVLVSQGLSPSLRQTRDGVVLSVASDEVERAAAALSAYESENPPKDQERDEPVGSPNLLVGIAIGGALLAFYSVTVTWKPTVPWFERGSADAERIILGELWRTVTALTLHADLVHVVANAIATAVFLGAISGMLGPGLGCALALLSGAGGNLMNALLHGPLHVSVGASTSVFGAVGLLGGVGVTRRRLRGMRGRRAWVPIAAALAILAMLGTGGQRVDLWAHLFGFLIGGVLGILVAFVVPRPPGPRAQWAFGSAALAAVITCWILALR